MELLVVVIVLGVIGFGIWQGVNAPSKSDIVSYTPQADGTRAVVCKACQVHMQMSQRQTRSALAVVFAMLLGLVGVVVLLAYNLMVGGVLLILAIVVSMAGRGSRAVLRCPSCGAEADI